MTGSVSGMISSVVLANISWHTSGEEVCEQRCLWYLSSSHLYLQSIYTCDRFHCEEDEFTCASKECLQIPTSILSVCTCCLELTGSIRVMISSLVLANSVYRHIYIFIFYFLFLHIQIPFVYADRFYEHPDQHL